MADHKATIVWTNGDGNFLTKRYSRVHRWEFDGGAVVEGSSSPTVVPVPMSKAEAVDPEEALIAAISSCHMLWFLALAANEKIEVLEYRDDAIGKMGINDEKQAWLAKVELRPRLTLAPGASATPDQLARLHRVAHAKCFIANSVRSEIEVIAIEPTIAKA